MTILATPYFLKRRPAELGESMVRTSHGMVQVSIPEATVLLLDPSTPDDHREWSFKDGLHPSVGSAVEIRGGHFLVATSAGLLEFDPDTSRRIRNLGLPELEFGRFAVAEDLERVRFNDGKVGPNGKAYFGVIFDASKVRKNRENHGCVVSIGPDGIWKNCISAVTTPNGGCWDRIDDSSAHFYLSDSPAKKINVYRHDFASDSFTLIRHIDMSCEAWSCDSGNWGRPDGMTIAEMRSGNDTKKVLLIAMFSGSKVIVIDPAMTAPRLLGTIQTAASKVTSVALLGSEAFITSGIAKDENHSGTTFRADLSALGIREIVLPMAW